MSISRDLSRLAPLIGTSTNTGQSLGTDGVNPTTLFPRKNIIINGNFDIWQRNSTFTIPTSAITYTADRWFGYRPTTGLTVSRITATQAFHTYALQAQRTASDANSNLISIGTILESTDSRYLTGKTIAVSFYAAAGANFSSLANGLNVVAVFGQGIDQSSLSAISGTWTNQSQSSQTITLSTISTEFKLIYNVPAGTTQVGLIFQYNSTGVAGVADSFIIERVQLERNNVATAFEYLPVGVTLALCQRYYEKSYDLNVFAGTITTAGKISSASSGPTGNISSNLSIIYKVTKRTIPTIAVFSAVTGTSGNWTAGASQEVTGTVLNSGTNSVNISTTYTSATTGGSGGHFTADAEL